MALLAALILSLMAGQSPSASVRAGVMLVSSETAVLAMEGPVLGVGTAVTLVTVDGRQQVWRAAVVKRLPECDALARHLTPGSYYEIAPDPGQEPVPGLSVAILGRPEIERVGGAVKLRLANPRIDVRVRGCSSSEGLHLTVWAGKPLRSRRLWHTYYYLGYDVEPNCQPADVREGGR